MRRTFPTAGLAAPALPARAQQTGGGDAIQIVVLHGCPANGCRAGMARP